MLGGKARSLSYDNFVRSFAPAFRGRCLSRAIVNVAGVSTIHAGVVVEQRTTTIPARQLTDLPSILYLE